MRSKWWSAFCYRKSTVDGSTITSVSVECLIWFIEVEFKEGNSKDLKINYNMAYKEQFVTPISSKYNGIYRCMFIGEEDDKFHFALYY